LKKPIKKDSAKWRIRRVTDFNPGIIGYPILPPGIIG